MEDLEEETKPWVPTGSNTLPFRVMSAENVPLSSSPTPVQTPIGPSSATLRGRLKLPPERYLPPPGPFYDQFTLALIFGMNFSVSVCWVCWDLPSNCTRRHVCTNECKVCGGRHPGEVSIA